MLISSSTVHVCLQRLTNISLFSSQISMAGKPQQSGHAFHVMRRKFKALFYLYYSPLDGVVISEISLW